MADAAEEAVRQLGVRVVVLTSARGYENPAVIYPSRETRNGVEIRRLPLSSFGKASILKRLLGQFLFLAQTVLHGLFVGNLKGILVSTSPPMASAAALVISFVRRAPITFWAMDLNPDQAIALGVVKADSFAARAFEALNRLLLRRAASVIALDRFMEERLRKKGPIGGKISVIPPWPHEDHLEPIPHAENPFRREHGLEGRFVVMYSGNLSIASPVTTLLEAIPELGDPFEFVFIGGGLGRREVERFVEKQQPKNVRLLPYQPMETLKYSLSAADVHVVTLGDGLQGIIHPCKAYGAMAVARPVLFIGPVPSHVGDLLAAHGFGWRLACGNVPGTISQLRAILVSGADRDSRGQSGRRAIETRLGRTRLRRLFIGALELRK